MLQTAEAAAKMPGMDYSASMGKVEALRMYLSTAKSDDESAMEFLGDMTKMIFEIRNRK